MDPVVSKRENRRKENITSSTFVAPKTTHFHSESVVFRHMPRASQDPWDAPEDTWISAGTNTDLQLPTWRGVNEKGTPSGVWVLGLEQNINSGGGESKSTDRLNSQQNRSCYTGHTWGIKDKLKNETASKSVFVQAAEKHCSAMGFIDWVICGTWAAQTQGILLKILQAGQQRECLQHKHFQFVFIQGMGRRKETNIIEGAEQQSETAARVTGNNL